MYTVAELTEMETIEINPVYGEQKIGTDKERVYLNGRRIAVERNVRGLHGNYWTLEIY